MSYKKISTVALALGLGLTGCSLSDTAQSTVNAVTSVVGTGIGHTSTSYANQRDFVVDGKALPIYETAARLLTNKAGDAPELVADIFDGKGEKAVAGYKIMLINRANSVLTEARKTPDGKIIDNRMVHRGTKALVGIPVVAGKPVLAQAVLLDFDVIADDPTAALKDGEIAKPRGKKLTKAEVPVTDKKVTVESLTLPNYKAGENAGGGVKFTASAKVDGTPVSTSANSTFQIFYTVTPDDARGFNQ